MKQNGSHYGIYFWLTIVTFVVPFFVAYRAFEKIAPTTKPVPQPDASGVDHNLWDYLLKSYVENGLIDYEGIKRDYLFKIYLQQLGAANFDTLANDDEKLALHCNAYNAFVINGVINHRISDSVTDFSHNNLGFFDQKEHLLGNRTLSLNELEHQIIRPTYREPRIHMALVCAARSCPAIRAEAYMGDRVRKQLEDQARLFANNTRHVRLDPSGKRIQVNSILKWYGEDWKTAGGYLNWIAQRVESPLLKAKLLEAAEKKIEVSFLKYDWSLNGQGPHSSYQPQKSEAGSGSIPNE
ncbi:MAG: DUF547 domain-containing protein [Planctomycetota bacterium]|nr:DUF547 domain-containing protein [Planctomycetota bacterium]